MANLVTLSSVTIAEALDRIGNEVKLSSSDGLLAGQRLYADRESMEVVRLLPSPWVLVRRGRDGTGSAPHANGATAWIAEPHQLYSRDPQGLPPTELLVSPWINVQTGDLWFAQGDVVPGTARWWQKQVATYGIGALGIRTKTLDPESSTV